MPPAIVFSSWLGGGVYFERIKTVPPAIPVAVAPGGMPPLNVFYAA